jgi:hypothetical protein
MRVPWLLALLLAALVLAGTAAALDPKDPQQRHTAADTSVAESLGLHLKDLPAGWTPAKATPNPPPCTTEPDESKLVETAQIDPTFIWKDHLTTIGTEVDIFKTAAMAKTDWGLSTLALFRSCLLESARDQLPGYTVTLLSAQKLPRPSATAERSLHYRLVFALTHQGTAIPIVSDVTALGKGRETVILHTFSVRAPLPSSDVSQLLRLLVGRLAGKSA